MRTGAGDLMFLLHLLVEIAARALSPAVNDLYIALAGADHVIGAVVHGFVRRLQPVTVRDPDGRLLVRTRSGDLPCMVEAAFSGPRRNGMHNISFALRLIDNIRRLAPVAAGHACEALILEHLDRIAEHAVQGLPPVDRAAIAAAATRARSAFHPEVWNVSPGN